MPTLVLPRYLRTLVPDDGAGGGGGSIGLEATTLSSAASEIRERFPGLADRVLTNEDGFGARVTIVLNGEIVQPRQLAATPLNRDDELRLLTAIAGG